MDAHDCDPVRHHNKPSLQSVHVGADPVFDWVDLGAQADFLNISLSLFRFENMSVGSAG